MGGGVEDRRTIELDVKRPADHDGATPDARNRAATKLWTISSSTNYVAVSSISAVAFAEKLLKTWARHAASGDLGATISPLANTDRKGGAFPFMHRQFLRAGGVTAATCNSALKLSRTHYLRSTKREAAYAANTNHSKYDPITLINAELAGASAMPMRDMARSNS
ncbi:hypothetical protein THAOC_04172 [Thalassiosira oceanica]|uniref:Uncharacterized protein n=1 Tax=Thalassiosira oceanica TaxID=159749 RepID=K0T5X6_THAOC|nr:hypothetical protein THAOC_04172 [Thalassiosira oceanica]|eukprot:EJK74168.1 hypothetical protein THAOC_04172 [Thalassiosira oceanica]